MIHIIFGKTHDKKYCYANNRILEKKIIHEYECEICEYEWNVENFTKISITQSCYLWVISNLIIILGSAKIIFSH